MFRPAGLAPYSVAPRPLPPSALPCANTLPLMGACMQRSFPTPAPCCLDKPKTAYMPSTEPVSRCPPNLLPSDDWEREVISNFVDLRQVGVAEVLVRMPRASSY